MRGKGSALDGADSARNGKLTGPPCPANDPAVEEAVRGTRAASLPCEVWSEPWTTRIVGQIRGSPRASTYRMDDGLSGQPGAMFVFFSNRLGCFGSLLVSAALTLVLLLILNVDLVSVKDAARQGRNVLCKAPRARYRRRHGQQGQGLRRGAAAPLAGPCACAALRPTCTQRGCGRGHRATADFGGLMTRHSRSARSVSP